jgi:hypothetical protein
MTSAGSPEDNFEAYLLAFRAALTAGLGYELAAAMVPEHHRDRVQARWLADRIVVEPIGVLSQGGPRPWFDDFDPAAGYHWPRLREFLMLHRNRSDSVLESLDNSTDRILSMLEDPRPGGPAAFKVRGLVVGYVQSGKTANFSALVAKALDAGYKIVIVLSGLHNSLRRQTQLRLEDELGLVADAPERRAVGYAEDGREIVPMTGAETWQDFHPGTADPALLQGSVRLIMVVKKNASVLRRLVNWLGERSPIASPVLVIDDEADQASINTGGNREPLEELLDLVDEDVDGGTGSSRAQREETDPSVINALIRRLLEQMHRVSYVGYTATPFANVLIDRDALDREVGADLYPADFIVSLPKPPGYVGTERLFGRAALSGEDEGIDALDVIRRVPDHEADLVNPGRHGPLVASLPPTLETALLDFVLATAARDTRVGGMPASAMLIHGSPYTLQQLTLGDLVRTALASLRQQWRYDHERTRPLFQQRWDDEFRPVSVAMDPERDLTFDQIEPALQRNFRSELPVLVLNTRTQDDLDYERNPDIRAVVVGGNKLSRGLTIEGLLTSYYVRPANYFDTLLQMGRWFGYREAYMDLTRLWTTDELRLRFRDLATSEEALRREIRLYDALSLTPRDFAPRIMTHATMQITAKNRMGSAREVSADYNGSLVQTINFQLRRRAWLTGNLDATRNFLSSLGTPDRPDAGRIVWDDVDWRQVEDFLGPGGYQTHAGASKVDSALMREYIRTQATRYQEVTSWTVAVRGRQTRDDRLGDEDLGIVNGPRVNCINRAREAESETSIGTLVNPVSRASPGGDEEIGLQAEDMAAARRFAEEEDVSYALALRIRRTPDRGLLLIYPISRHSSPRRGRGQDLFDDVDRDGETVIGVAAVFPYSTSPATVRFVVGSAGAAHP